MGQGGKENEWPFTKVAGYRSLRKEREKILMRETPCFRWAKD